MDLALNDEFKEKKINICIYFFSNESFIYCSLWTGKIQALIHSISSELLAENQPTGAAFVNSDG